MSTRHATRLVFALLASCGVPTIGWADEPKEFAASKYRLVGPFAGGRVARACGVTGDPLTYYAATASGGVWKSSDGGLTWKSVFDDQPTSSIGSIAVAASDPNVVYVGSGEANIRSNVSPGAAYAHDPDGHGHVYHRAGSFAPGRVSVPASDHLDVTLDVAGDRRMTERFVAEVLRDRRPTLAVLWLGEPDHIQHELPLGSPEHRAVLAQADAHAGLVIEAVGRLRDAGDDILLLVGSDHGHQTVTGRSWMMSGVAIAARCRPASPPQMTWMVSAQVSGESSRALLLEWISAFGPRPHFSPLETNSSSTTPFAPRNAVTFPSGSCEANGMKIPTVFFSAASTSGRRTT